MNKKVNQKQKARDVTKLIIFFYILLLINISCFSQKSIIGKYINIRGNDFSTETSFDNKGIFGEINYHEGTPTDYGKGHYYIKKDSLVLNYDLTELKTDNYHKYTYYCSPDNTVSIKITVLDMNEKPIFDASIDNDTSNIELRTKEDGTVTFILKEERKKVNFVVSNENYGGYIFPIWIDRSYNIKVYLKKDPYNTMPFKGGIVKYKIVSITKDSIKLKADNGSIVWKRKKE